jgi:transposase
MARGDLTDHDWQQLEPLLPPQTTTQQGNQYKDHRTVVNGIL